ncbi:MAG: alpha/beta-type small acid-soluble spore protein [Defluviitaleaceae bacterium]|nr:alpha/beta-type small acid-soluble spore protein [Defluviitaleaceae bacterium]
MEEKPGVNDIMKMEIAEELGLLDKVKASGWKSLTSKESGRIGGILARRKKRSE